MASGQLGREGFDDSDGTSVLAVEMEGDACSEGAPAAVAMEGFDGSKAASLG